jgi:hypothetical protein
MKNKKAAVGSTEYHGLFYLLVKCLKLKEALDGIPLWASFLFSFVENCVIIALQRWCLEQELRARVIPFHRTL